MQQNIVIAGLVALGFLVSNALFIVDQSQQAIKLQLGEPVGGVIDKPGLHFKIPFIQQVKLFDKRILETDAAPGEVITKEKKTLLIDNFSKWKIVDPLKFLQTVRTEEGAIQRLNDIIFSELRVEVGLHNLIEIVSDKRADLMRKVTKRCNDKAHDYGIEVIDVRVKRADLPAENAQAIFNRMQAERKRIAREYRSEGEEESKKIRSATDKKRTVMLAEAYEKEQLIRSRGDAESIRISAEAISQDPEFYTFLRTLEAYRKTLKQNTTLAISPDADFFNLLRGMEK